MTAGPWHGRPLPTAYFPFLSAAHGTLKETLF